MKFSTSVGIALLFTSCSIFASSNITAKVNFVGSYGNGDFFVNTDTVIDENECPNTNKNRFDVANDHPQAKYWLSIAMAALASGKSITFKTNGCYEGFPTMDNTRNSFILIREQ